MVDTIDDKCNNYTQENALTYPERILSTLIKKEN